MKLSEKLPRDIMSILDYPDTISSSINSIHPTRLQEGTWRIGGVLKRFLMLDLDGHFGNSEIASSRLFGLVSLLAKDTPLQARLRDNRAKIVPYKI